VLDVATGPGFVAGAADERGATVVGLDFSPAMIVEAQRRHPTVSFREGDAEALPFEDGSFDAVVMNFGLLHLARPEAAIGEACRVLRPGGRYALTVWAAPEQAAGFGMVLRAIEAFGKTDVPLPAGPPFFRFSDAGECRRTLEDAGFSGVDVKLLPLTWRCRPRKQYSTRCRGEVCGRLPCCGRSLRRRSSRYAPRCSAGPDVRAGRRFVVPMPAVLASASKPQS